MDKSVQSEPVVVWLSDFSEVGVQEATLERIKQAGGRLYLNVKLPSIGYCDSHLDIASDYLDALFVGETIYPLCTRVDWQHEYRESSHLHYIQYCLESRNLTPLIDKLRWLACGIDCEDDCDQETFEQVRSCVSDFESELPFRRVHFVELADNYMINQVTGQSYENIGDDADSVVWNEFFPNQPECKFGYILSAMTHEFGGQCFSSTSDWIIAAGLPIEQLLVKYGGLDGEIQLSQAAMIRCGDMDVATNDRVAVKIEYSAFEDGVRMLRETGRLNEPGSQSFRISQDGSILIADIGNWMFVNFAAGESRLGKVQLESVIARLGMGVESLRQCLGRPTMIACNWDGLSDERFERLCCDVLERCGHYDRERITKMGRSRSRDGGRDIIAFSNPRAGRPSRKFIFQCKRIGKDKALCGKNVSVSDVVDQFGAGGFGVMTSGLIDATLYDKVEQIANNRSIDRDWWDQLRLERFLAENTDIKNRYFDGSGEPQNTWQRSQH